MKASGWTPARIRRELGDRGLSLAEVARRAGVHRSTAARRLAAPPPKLAVVVARALRVKRSTIWPRTFAARSNTSATPGPYEGATAGRRLGSWGLGGYGPNAALWSALPSLRSRSRELRRNNSWVQKGIDTYVANVIGTGIVPHWKLDDVELKNLIQRTWLRWTDEADAAGVCDFYGMQALTARTHFVAGESLARFRPRLLEDGLTVPLQIQGLEPDHLDESRDGLAAGSGNLVRYGIEFDRLGRRVAYHLRREHPGDALPMSGVDFGRFETVRVPASEVLHVYQPDRFGQARGIPRLVTVILRLYQFDHYEDAELVRKTAAAMIGGFITDTAVDAIPFGKDLGRDAATRQLVMGLEPGTFPLLRPGQDVRFSAPADVGGSYDPWTRLQLRAIAAGMFATYEQMTGDLSQVNYTSIRAGLVELRRQLEQLIWHVFVFQFCRPVLARWMDFAVASGALPIHDYNANRARYLDVE